MTITFQALSLVEKAPRPSSLHTTLEGPTEYVCECKMDAKSTCITTWHPIDHVSWSPGLFSKITSWSGPNTNLGDHGIPNVYNC
jgi:hypothetical protein